MSLVIFRDSQVRRISSTIEPASHLKRRGWFSPQHFPVVAAFHRLSDEERDALVDYSKSAGVDAAIRQLQQSASSRSAA